MASQVNDSDGGSSMTPSEQSEGDDRSERDSDYETDNGEEEENDCRDKDLNIIWTGYAKRIPVVLFNVSSVLQKHLNFKIVGERYHLAFKFGATECKIIRNILTAHGFHEVHPGCPDYNLLWTNSHLKPFTLRSMTEFQKINHFPRSYELTRKDRLYKNIQRMQQIKGVKHFDFVPQSFILPGEFQDFCSQFLKDRGPWIVKPVASSRGRGVFLVSHPDQVPLDENLIVSHYLNNPMVIDGFKFDVRVYVAVTSYDPLVIYMYEEGLTRFATVKYEKSTKHIRNQCMHLTNYSVNKKSHDYVKNDDPDVEDYGNKWSMGAMLRYLRSMGKDTAALMMRIEDAVIKTLLSVELSIATASKMFMPHRGNCFELYGFDILIDDTLKPWVLEVNLSPSLACDSPLDLKIKGNMLCDLFSLAGIICHDPVVRSFQQQPRKNHDVTAKINSGRAKKLRPQSAGSQAKPGNKSSMTGLNSEEIKILRRVKEEEHRSGGWIRIFPSLDTWDIHGAFLQFNTTHNFMLHQRLYPDRHKIMGMKSPGLSSAARSRSGYLQITGTSHTRLDSEKAIESYTLALIRARQYERKLGSKNRRRKKEVQQKGSRPRLAQGVADEEEEGEHNSDEEDELRGDVKSKQEEAEDKKSNEASEKAPGSGLNQEAISKSTLHETAEIKVQEVKIDALVPSPSAPSPPDPNYSVVDLLLKGHTMSKVQARSAFAMYLVRVQQRLIAEIGPLLQNDVDTLNEQMNLVLRFLKRAAVNLQQTFRVVVPSRKLPLGDRRRILAKQLGDFVHIYNKETEQLREQVKTEKQSKITRETNTEERLDERRFEQFVSIASEGELEEVLTTYTKLNKSASIFLGSNSTYSVPAKPAHNPVPPPSAQRAEMHLRQYETGDGNQLDNQHGIYSASYTDIRETGNGQPSRPPSASATSYSSALSIYNQKLTRPRSANTYKAPAFFSILDSDKVVKAGSRPISAYGAKTSPFTTSEPVVDTFNEQAIREALHRLAVRQQTRQYSAVNSYSSLKPNFLNPSHNSTHQQTAEISTQLVAHKLPDSHSNSSTDLCYINKEHCQTSYSRVPKNSVDRPPLGKPLPGSGMKDVPASVHMGKAIFGSFVDEFDNDNTHWQTEIASAYSQVTGVEPNNYLTASVNSRQFQLALQHSKQNSDANNQFSQDTTQRRLQEQIMKKQSHTLMEANKAKHHAMVAQAHAAQRSHQCLGGSPLVVVEVEAPLSGFAPKPPVQPAHACSKPTAFHRLTRLHPGTDDTLLSVSCFSNLHYDVHEGHMRRKAENKVTEQ